MSSIKIFMKDGAVHDFPHKGRPGGSFTKTLKLENGFAIVTDEWYARTVFPAQDIERIEETPERC